MSAKRKYFGTDGVRGTANVHPMTPEFAVSLGAAAARILVGEGKKGTCLIGRDTRVSGEMLESALAAGIASAGCDAELAGVLPTPAVAHLVEKGDAAFGAVISASHNPAADNGIKLVAGDGFKLPDAVELQIEATIENGNPGGLPAGRIQTLDPAAGEDSYVAHAVSTMQGVDLKGIKIAIDNAHGAASATSPAALEALGAEVVVHYSAPDGININAGCGCTYPEVIEGLVSESGAQVGISHDGDADRVALVDETGSALDGDEVLAIAARHLLAEGKLAHDTLVATVMSNAGLEKSLAEVGGKVVRTDVGDRYVLESMRAHGYTLGGEQSGHVIFGNLSTTGDGLVTALQILRIVQETGKPLSELRSCLRKLPQFQRSVPVASKPALEEMVATAAEVTETEGLLAGDGRVLLRYSGTEPVLRILLEGEDPVMLAQRGDALEAAILKDAG